MYPHRRGEHELHLGSQLGQVLRAHADARIDHFSIGDWVGFMLERFVAHFVEDGPALAGATFHVRLEPEHVLAVLSGRSFNGGLYRLHTPKAAVKWNAIVGWLFGLYAGRISVFGYDWLGRQFALDSGRIENGRPLVVMFDAAHGENFLIPADIAGFHDKILVDLPEPTLAQAACRAWRAAGNGPPPLGQCAGFKRPLVMGGSDEVANLAPIDIAVEWELLQQLWSAKRRLPEGASTDKVRVRDSAVTFPANQGVPVRLNGNYAIFHHKFIVFDSRNVETGSFNFSAAASAENAENVLLLRNVPELAGRYAQEWQRLLGEGADVKPRHQHCCQGANRPSRRRRTIDRHPHAVFSGSAAMCRQVKRHAHQTTHARAGGASAARLDLDVSGVFARKRR